MKNLFDAQFTFNSSGSMHAKESFKVFLDNNGNIIDKDQREYGIYNKVLKINISTLLFIKKHYVGLGDIIDFITRKLYIKALLIYLTNGNCGCETRRILFNKWVQIPWFSIHKRPLYLDDEEILNDVKNYKKRNIKLQLKEEYNKIIGGSLPSMKRFFMNNDQNTEQQQPKPEAPKPVKPKGGCGCGQRR